MGELSIKKIMYNDIYNKDNYIILTIIKIQICGII